MLLLKIGQNALTTLLHSADEMFNAKPLISKLPTFSVPKITAVRRRVTRLKDALKMADLISIEDSVALIE